MAVCTKKVSSESSFFQKDGRNILMGCSPIELFSNLDRLFVGVPKHTLNTFSMIKLAFVPVRKRGP
jgi:hypothetical protein